MHCTRKWAFGKVLAHDSRRVVFNQWGLSFQGTSLAVSIEGVLLAHDRWRPMMLLNIRNALGSSYNKGLCKPKLAKVEKHCSREIKRIFCSSIN